MKGLKILSYIIFSIFIVFTLLIITMCHVPSSKKDPYLSAGERYYETVLNATPKVSSSFFLSDEAGGFSLHVKFNDMDLKNQKVKTYLSFFGYNKDNELSFRGTSTEPNIVGLSDETTEKLRKSNEYEPFNSIVSMELDKMFFQVKEGDQRTKISELIPDTTVSFYSTDLEFWGYFITNHDELNKKSFTQKIEWLKSESTDKSFFVVDSSDVNERAKEDTIKLVKGNILPINTVIRCINPITNEKNYYNINSNHELELANIDYLITY